MAVDKNKIIAEATKFVQKGAYDKAIAAYQKILAVDPKEVRSLLKIAELHQKKGDDRAAAAAFERVAETYAEQGFFLKSVAVYKQIVKIDPEDVRVNERLAGLYQQLGLMSDAMSQYQFMAAAYERAGDGAKLTDVLRRMVELDPENIASSIKLGELYARSGQVPAALECLGRAADYLKRHNRADEYLKVAERIATLSPGDVALTRELANIYLAKGDTKRALAKLQLCFKEDAKDVQTLQLLAQAFRDLGQTSKTISVYKELAQVHEERGQHQEARTVWRKVQELAPEDEEASLAVGAAAVPVRRAGPGTGATPAGGSARPPAPGPPPAARPPPGPPPPASAGPEAIAKLLSETDVYVKYSLYDKALDHLKKVLALDLLSAEAHERARDIHAASGRRHEAASSGILAVRALLARGHHDRVREALVRLRQIAPDHPDLRELHVAAMATEEVELGEGDVVEGDLLLPDDVADEGHVADDDALALAAAGHQDEDVVEGEASSSAPDEHAGEDDEVLAAARASAEAEEVVEEPPPAPPAAAPPPLRAAAARAAAPPPDEDDEDIDLSDEIEEVDFFVQQGLLDEARETLENLLAFYPEHRGLRAKHAELERRTRPSAPAPATPARSPSAPEASPAPDAQASFDIARELADELGPPPAPEDEFQYSVEDVFNQFKKGVEQTVKREDSATHYDLGIAYKEMGLLDDAIHEFETALGGNDRRKEVDCLSMIGLCRMAKGEAREAVAAFRRALGSGQLTKDAAKAIHYDLATAYERGGDREAALYYFQRVMSAEAGFRDVRKRVTALGGGPGRAPPEEARPAARGGVPAPRAPAAPAGGPPRPASTAKKNIGYL